MTGVLACAVIPSHNHWQALPAIIERLRGLGLPVFVIDDGSTEVQAQAALAALHAPDRQVRLTRLPSNRGKGAAVLAGFALAGEAGYTHCVQVDADGQHDLAEVGPMLSEAAERPDAIIAGQAVFDRSAPLGRMLGRWITHACVWLETLSFDVRDSMCGLRVYPLAAVSALLARGERVGARMDFDTEIIVRLKRAGTPVVSHPVRIVYPAGNTSNFRMLRDNWLITKMHTRLLLGTLFGLPSPLLGRMRASMPMHWSGFAERGFYWTLRVSAAAYRTFGRRGCMVLLAPVVLYFYATAGERRRASLDFLERAFAARGQGRRPSHRDGYQHFMSFARRAVDNLAAWMGRLTSDDVVPADGLLEELAAQSTGALFIVSHHGNVDVSRASLDRATRRRVVVLMHTRHAENYNRVLREFNPEAALNIFQVTDMGPDVAIDLQQRIEQGEWLFIAGDRTPVGGGRTVRAGFLGAEAEFPQGPYLLAALLGCPVYLFFCRRDGTRYVITVEKLADRLILPRGGRAEAIAAYAATYAHRLEKQVLEDPLQWYNFYDFWQPARTIDPP